MKNYLSIAAISLVFSCTKPAEDKKALLLQQKNGRQIPSLKCPNRYCITSEDKFIYVANINGEAVTAWMERVYFKIKS